MIRPGEVIVNIFERELAQGSTEEQLGCRRRLVVFEWHCNLREDAPLVQTGLINNTLDGVYG